jgi:hypothetical protein
MAETIYAHAPRLCKPAAGQKRPLAHIVASKLIAHCGAPLEAYMSQLTWGRNFERIIPGRWLDLKCSRMIRRASEQLSPQSCSHRLNIVTDQVRLYDGVAFGIERNGAAGPSSRLPLGLLVPSVSGPGRASASAAIRFGRIPTRAARAPARPLTPVPLGNASRPYL